MSTFLQTSILRFFFFLKNSDKKTISVLKRKRERRNEEKKKKRRRDIKKLLCVIRILLPYFSIGIFQSFHINILIIIKSCSGLLFFTFSSVFCFFLISCLIHLRYCLFLHFVRNAFFSLSHHWRTALTIYVVFLCKIHVLFYRLILCYVYFTIRFEFVLICLCMCARSEGNTSRRKCVSE